MKKQIFMIIIKKQNMIFGSTGINTEKIDYQNSI